MRRLLAITQLTLLKAWKDKIFLVLLTATAIVFTSISGVFLGSAGGPVTVPVSVTDYDNSALTRQMISDLQGDGGYVVTLKAEESVYQDVRQGNVDTGIIIPAGFETSLSSENPPKVVVVSLTTSKAAMVTGKIMERSLTAYLPDHAVRSVAAEKAWGRLLITPASKASILGGKVIGTFVLGLSQVVVLFLCARYLFRVNFGGNTAAILLVLALMMLVVTGLGLFLSTVVRTSAQLQALAPIVIVSTCMLGGCYWPLDVVTPLMRTIAKITPQAWAMNALTDVMLRGKSLAATATNLAVLAGFGVLFFALGVARVKYE